MAFVLVAYYVGVFRSGTGTCCVCVHGGGYGLGHFMPGPKDEPLGKTAWSSWSRKCVAGVLLRLLSVLRQTEPCVDGLALEPILHCKEFCPWFQVSHFPPLPRLRVGDSKEDDVATGAGSYLLPPSVLR